jgi:hypothetical protein
MADDYSKYRQHLESMQLGELIDHLICLRTDGNSGSHDEIDTTVKIKYIKNEISRRQTGRRVNKKDGKRGVSSLSSLL